MADNKNTDATGKLDCTQKPRKMIQRIGSTIYEVSVHFSETSNESINDKILRLIQSDPQK